MNKRFVAIVAITILALLFMNQSVHAHSFYVSITKSMAHPPGHITVNLGWGHVLPMDDFLTGDKLATYEIYDPDFRRMEFPFDPGANKGVENSKGKEYPDFPGGTMLQGDAYCRQVLFKDDSPQGTYQVAASMNKTQITGYIDKKGKKQWNRKTLDQIKDAKEIMESTVYQAFAKAFTTVGKWTQPKALGHDLELIPLTDLSQVHAGDMVSFKVLLKGQSLKPKFGDYKPWPTINAERELYGAETATYSLQGYVDNGEAGIRLPASGRWIVTLNLFKPVTKKDGPKELIGKCLSVGYKTSVTFEVR